MLVTIALFLSLGLDTFAVAVGLGVKGLPRQRWLRTGLTFALFEGLMPAVGLLVGRRVTGSLGDLPDYAAGALLVALGAWELREAIVDVDAKPPTAQSALIGSAWLLGLSVSLDELAVGFALGVVGASVGIALACIAAQALVITLIGLSVGARAANRLQERAELAAGGLLVLLGFFILISTSMR